MASGSGGGRGRGLRDFVSSVKEKASNRGLLRADSSPPAQNNIGGDCDAAPAPLPPPEISNPFPVIEQPSRCVFTSLRDPKQKRALTSTRNGALQTTTSSPGDREQFLLIPVSDSLLDDGRDDDGSDEKEIACKAAKRSSASMFYLRSYKFNRYLTSNPDGTVATIDLSPKNESGRQLGESEKWILMRSPHGGHLVVSAKNELNLACVPSPYDEGHFPSMSIGLKGDNDSSESWDIEFVSGELCFLSSSSSEDKRVRCDLLGKLTLTDDQRGWEVWRFVETGAGKVRIVSWMHPFCIVCSHDGKVSTKGIGKAEEGCDEWTVEKAPDGYHGVIVKSVACARRILSRGVDGCLESMQELESESGVWHVDAAHSQIYTLTSLRHNRSVGPFPYVTDNSKQSDQLILHQIDGEGMVRMYHKSRGMYICSRVEGEVEFSSDDQNHVSESSCLWRMKQRADGGYTFLSEKHGELLAFTEDEVNPKLCTVPGATDDSREAWCVNPTLPRAVSSSKIKTFALGTSVAVGTTVAMPFLMAGMLAVVPAEATLAASILSVGLTSAEAIASVGAIGATAAIVFRESSDTLGMESEHDGEDGRDYTKRPLCAWRSW